MSSSVSRFVMSHIGARGCDWLRDQPGSLERPMKDYNTEAGNRADLVGVGSSVCFRPVVVEVCCTCGCFECVQTHEECLKDGRNKRLEPS